MHVAEKARNEGLREERQRRREALIFNDGLGTAKRLVFESSATYDAIRALPSMMCFFSGFVRDAVLRTSSPVGPRSRHP